MKLDGQPLSWTCDRLGGRWFGNDWWVISAPANNYLWAPRFAMKYRKKHHDKV